MPRIEDGKLIVVCIVCGDEHATSGRNLAEVFDELDTLGWWYDGDSSEKCPRCVIKETSGKSDSSKP